MVVGILSTSNWDNMSNCTLNKHQYIIVTLIGNMSSCNWDNMCSTLSKMLATTFDYIHSLQSSLELLLSSELHGCLIYSSLVGDIVLWLFKIMFC